MALKGLKMTLKNKLRALTSLVLLWTILVSCGGGGSRPLTSVDIKANGKDAELSITVGESVTLTWSIENPPENRSCKLIQNEEGPEKGDEELPIENKCGGTKTVTPSKSTQYTISGSSNQGGPVTDKVIVEVDTSVPSITSFFANKETITKGEEVTLSWKAENAALCSLKTNIESATEETVNCESTRVLKPESNTSYTFKAARANGEAATEQSLNITVQIPPAKVIAYAWANNLSTASYTPSATYSYNSSGGAISATRSSVGTYSISFAGLSIDGGNIQISSYSSNEYCNLASWSSSTVNVICHDSSGILTDSRYTVTVISNSATSTGEIAAYAWANDLTSASYTPSATYSYNSSGGVISATRSSVGTYSISFADLAITGGNVQVSSYASDAYCNVGSWGGSSVSVRCYDSSGILTDSRYTVTVISDSVTSTSEIAAYAWVNEPTSASHTPNSVFSYNSSGGAITATRSSVGTYSISFADLVISGGNIQVSGFGTDAHCNVASWGSSSVNVRCYNSSGVATDSRYTVTVISN